MTSDLNSVSHRSGESSRNNRLIKHDIAQLKLDKDNSTGRVKEYSYGGPQDH